MDNVFDLLPKNKFDSSGMEGLKRLSDEEIHPILPALLEWIQDMNWPVAQKVLPVLAMHEKCLVPLIRARLQPGEGDDIWKYWIVARLLPLFSQESLASLLPSLERIALQPTDGEKDEGVDGLAADFLWGRS